MTSVATKGTPSPVADAFEPRPQMAVVRSDAREEDAEVTTTAVDFAGLMRFCEELVPTGFLPEHIKTAGQAAAIILAGRELRMDPMLALRSITMVKGKIVVSADAQLALFKKAGGHATFSKLSDTEAVLDLVHPNGDRHTETFTTADAKRAGLDRPSRNGEPSMYSKFPKAMLRSRAITAGLKSIGFEPTSGTYDPDEAQHFMPAEAPAPIRQQVEAAADVRRDDTTDVQDLMAIQSGKSTATSEVNAAEPPITPDTEIDFGKQMRGKKIKDLSDSDLEWMIEDGRRFGARTKDWQKAARMELDRRAYDASAQPAAAPVDADFDVTSLEDTDDKLPF